MDPESNVASEIWVGSRRVGGLNSWCGWFHASQMRWAQEDFQRKVLRVALTIQIPGVCWDVFSIMTTTMLHERCYRTVCRADTEIHFDPFWFLQFPFMKLRHRQPEATLLKKQWILSPLPTWWQIAWRMCFSFTWNCQTNISQIRVQHCLTMMVSYESCTIYLCPFYPLHLDNLEQFALHTWLSGWVGALPKMSAPRRVDLKSIWTSRWHHVVSFVQSRLCTKRQGL